MEERKKKKQFRIHTKFRSAVYSNSLAITNQKMGVITTRIDAMTFRSEILESHGHFSDHFFKICMWQIHDHFFELQLWIDFYARLINWASFFSRMFFRLVSNTGPPQKHSNSTPGPDIVLVLWLNLIVKCTIPIYRLVFWFTFYKLRIKSRSVVVIFDFWFFNYRSEEI